MSLKTAARAARLGLKSVRGVVPAVVLVLLAAGAISCGNNRNPQNGPSHNAYVTLPSRGSVLLLHINGSTGAITSGGATPQVLGTSPNGLALLPSKKFLYVANAQANTITIFSVASDGTLSLTGNPINAGSGPHAAVIDPSGKYLLITNSFTNDISVFSIDGTSGALQEVAGSPFFANNNPAEILFVASGKFVYVTNPTNGLVTAFTFSSATGALQQIVGSPFAANSGASALAVGGSEKFLYVANTTAPNPGLGTVGNISAFNIVSTTGALSPIFGSPFTSKVGNNPSTLVVTPDNRFLYATTAGSSFSIWCFTIDAASGQLTAVTNSPFSQNAGDLFSLIDTTGNYLYIGGQSANGITGYTYDANNGTPKAITGSPFSTGVPPGKMVIVR
jgi:6-phosphogluconolactonase (cycloisomerase 2 family)